MHGYTLNILSALEAQLTKQKAENDSERERLQTLIAKLESHVSQQNKRIEDESWQLKQDKIRLGTQQSAFENERSSYLLKLETERDKLQQSKEKLLVEQKEILSQCYEERKSLAAQRVELSVLHKKALEREQWNKQASFQLCKHDNISSQYTVIRECSSLDIQETVHNVLQ